MASAAIIATDQDSRSLLRWQLLRSPSAAISAIVAARLAENFYESTSTAQAVSVEAYESILVQAWGVASDTHTGVISLYGWPESGPGHHLANVTATFCTVQSAALTGFHATDKSHPSIREGFAAATAYNGCDLYALTADYSVNTIETGGILVPSVKLVGGTPEDNFACAGFAIDFSVCRYKFLSAFATTLTSATSLGLIFRALKMRDQ